MILKRRRTSSTKQYSESGLTFKLFHSILPIHRGAFLQACLVPNSNSSNVCVYVPVSVIHLSMLCFLFSCSNEPYLQESKFSLIHSQSMTLYRQDLLVGVWHSTYWTLFQSGDQGRAWSGGLVLVKC